MPLASISERFIALIIDSILVGIVGAILGLNGDAFLGIGLSTVLALAYNWFFWTRQEGQTIGKSVMGIRVVKVGGGPISDKDAIIRYVGYHVNTWLLLLGWIWALLDDKHQGFHDKLANTVVVKA